VDIKTEAREVAAMAAARFVSVIGKLFRVSAQISRRNLAPNRNLIIALGKHADASAHWGRGTCDAQALPVLGENR
jgi:hypothetical protein